MDIGIGSQHKAGGQFKWLRLQFVPGSQGSRGAHSKESMVFEEPVRRRISFIGINEDDLATEFTGAIQSQVKQLASQAFAPLRRMNNNIKRAALRRLF